jgi:hypothetical protein
MPVCFCYLYKRFFGYNKRQQVKRVSCFYTETPECAVTRCSGGHRFFVLDTDALADLTFRCAGYDLWLTQ